MKNDEVNAYIHEHLMKEDEIVSRLQEQARGVGDYFDKNTGQLEIRRLVADGKGHLIKEQEKLPGGVRVKFYDAQAALVILAKYRKLLTDKTEIDIGDRLAAKMDKYASIADKIYADRSNPGEDSTNSA
jgi:hypothetical protein